MTSEKELFMNDVRRLAARRKEENFRFSLKPEAVKALIRRICGDAYADIFTVQPLTSTDGYDAYRLSDTPRGILLEATSGVAAASALRFYLHTHCKAYAGLLTERLSLPEAPPLIGATIEKKSPFLYRYFFNYCTFGYTCAFWDFAKWERFIDRLLLSGYNLILNPIGNEAVFLNTLLTIGYTKEDARRFLSAPVFYPWQCMLNLSGYGGAAPEDFYTDRVMLSKKITERLNELGAEVVLPGYSGIVPDDFSHYCPNARLLIQGDWCNFKRPSLISYQDAWFDKIADTYYKEQEKLFGKHSYFSVDPFHEGGNSSSVDMYAYGKACYRAMHKASETAVWVLQGWSTNPNRSMLHALHPADALVINLKSEVNIDGGDDFAGHPWLYGCVNNFGGRRVPRANLCSQYSGPHAAIQNNRYSAVGLGLLPEAVTLDEAAFDIFADNAFEDTLPPMEAWLHRYLLYRYGSTSPSLEKAWKHLCDTVYIHDTSATPKESPFSTRPSLKASMITPACGTDAFTYHPSELLTAIRLFTEDLYRFQSSLQYRFDLCELLRQLVALVGWGVLREIEHAFQNRDMAAFRKEKEQFLTLFAYLSRVMQDSPEETLSANVEKARSYGKSEDEKAYFEGILKTLYTSWGDRSASEILHDYSARELSGMIEGFYLPRWKTYFAYLEASFDSAQTISELDLSYPYYDEEQAFCLSPVAPLASKKESFSYLDALLTDCEALIKAQSISVSFQKQTNAMELK